MSYTIAQAAKKCGLSAHTLRYYEKEGLMPFVDRAPSGIRAFKDDDFEWLRIITCLKKTGMPVKQIRQFIDWCLEGDATLKQRLRLFVEQKESVQNQIEQLNRYMEMLDYKIWYYETAVKAGTADIHKNQKLSRKETARPRKKIS